MAPSDTVFPLDSEGCISTPRRFCCRRRQLRIPRVFRQTEKESKKRGPKASPELRRNAPLRKILSCPQENEVLERVFQSEAAATRFMGQFREHRNELAQSHVARIAQQLLLRSPKKHAVNGFGRFARL